MGLIMLVMLLTRENDGWPTGSFPLAFSDIPRSCRGTASSMEEMEGVREVWFDGEDWEEVGCIPRASSSESSSSPTAKAPPSSGTLRNSGNRALWGLCVFSQELLRPGRIGLLAPSGPSADPFRSRFSFSSSSWPLFRVKDLRASSRLRDLKTV